MSDPLVTLLLFFILIVGISLTILAYNNSNKECVTQVLVTPKPTIYEEQLMGNIIPVSNVFNGMFTQDSIHIRS